MTNPRHWADAPMIYPFRVPRLARPGYFWGLKLGPYFVWGLQRGEKKFGRGGAGCYCWPFFIEKLWPRRSW